MHACVQVVAKCRQARGDNGGKFHFLAGDMSSETFYSQLIQVMFLQHVLNNTGNYADTHDLDLDV